MKCLDSFQFYILRRLGYKSVTNYINQFDFTIGYEIGCFFFLLFLFFFGISGSLKPTI